MKMTVEKLGARAEFLASAKFKAVNHVFEQDTASGTAVKVTDGLGNTKYGFCLYDVKADVNPNGAVVVEGIVSKSKLPEEPSEEAKANFYPSLVFVD